jgi:hypothetical protein
MRHLKPFDELFEDLGSSTVLNFSREDVKNRESYKDLIASGFKDITPPRSEEGTFRFSHPSFDGMDYLIYTTGYIRRQDTTNDGPWRNTSMVTQSVIPPDAVRSDYRRDETGKMDWVTRRPSNSSIIYGRPIKSPEDYDIKFEWLKNIADKKIAKLTGTKYIPNPDPKVVIDGFIKFAQSSPAAALKVKRTFPKIWDEIKTLPDMDTLADLADLGF